MKETTKTKLVNPLPLFSAIFFSILSIFLIDLLCSLNHYKLHGDLIFQLFYWTLALAISYVIPYASLVLNNGEFMHPSSLKGNNPLRFFVDLYQLNQNSNIPPPLLQLAKTDKSIRDYLFRIIQASTEDEAFRKAATNAITILNEARVPMSGRTF